MRDLKPVAFVGAGASAGMYPLWGELIGLLADYAVVEGKAGPKDADRWKADKTFTPQQRVNTILRKLGEAHYHNFLKATFGPRRGPDGRRYTPTHAALMRLPFHGYVTTNYDPGLEFARMELRPGCLTTGTPTWQDDGEVHRWLVRDAAAPKEDGREGWLSSKTVVPGDECPILWLHGYWQRPQSIVLNSGEYSAAYNERLYRRLFGSLWMERQLIFVGFGFQDPQFTFMVREYLRELEDARALLRHVAILGLPAKEDGSPPDESVVREWRENLEAEYYVRPLFYPVHGGDHSALHVLLDDVAAACGRATPGPAVVASAAPAAVSSSPRPSAAKWFHEPTNDDKFVGREDELARLDRWVRDAAVRAVGVSAVGGTGKTALVGHWLKETEGWRARPFAGLFGWSFYQDRDPTNFLHELLLWTHETLGTPKPKERSHLFDQVMAVCRQHPLVIVLDGLEVLQEGPGAARHGAFLDPGLLEFLNAFCHRRHHSLAVLTSRFVFADLARFLGTAFHQLELHGLPPAGGAELLDGLGVGGTFNEREEVSESLDGHPLGLRVFAGALPAEDREQPCRFLSYAFRPGEVRAGAPLNDKLRRLLTFYEKRLPAVQARLLSVVALFRTPVADETVFRLARGLYGRQTDQPLPEDAELNTELRRLHATGILTHEPVEGGYGSACHPILRDHFRSTLLGAGSLTARRAADLLKGPPSNERAQSTSEIEPVLLATGLLLDAGEFDAADQLYRGRLENGHVFSTLPAPTEGLGCALGFVQDEERRRRCQEVLGSHRLAIYLNEAGRHAMDVGQYEPALHYYEESHAVIGKMTMTPRKSVSIVLQNISELLVVLGRLPEAGRAADKAISDATREMDEMEIRDSYAYRGWASALSGHVVPAAADFTLGDMMEKLNALGLLPESGRFYGVRGVQWAELLVRCGHTDMVARRMQSDLRICEHRGWKADSARCHFMLGWCALAEGRLEDAEEELRVAEVTMQRGHLLYWLARLHVAAGELALARRNAESALHRAAEALTLAAPRGVTLVHADALVLRGRARLLEGRPEGVASALDDAEEALRLALQCGYAWAERDALLLAAAARASLAEGHRAAGNASSASRELAASLRAGREAEARAADLVLTAENLSAAKAKAMTWLREAPWMKRRK
ncbi:MAG TPA: SIR2 family protein [Pyrinomonadaceae bacterium]|nr:SIR2 family protein [Pyrinomonadaceae bacterium]